VDEVVREKLHNDIAALATKLVDDLTRRRLSVAVAESCTGGWVAKSITDIAGSSDCFGFGIVSYSNEAKRSLLDVREQTLTGEGAVSEACVHEMAEGALKVSGADCAVAISGIAGPGGGTEDKPVGTVWMAWCLAHEAGLRTDSKLYQYPGARDEVRMRSVRAALDGLRKRLSAAVPVA